MRLNDSFKTKRHVAFHSRKGLPFYREGLVFPLPLCEFPSTRYTEEYETGCHFLSWTVPFRYVILSKAEDGKSDMDR